MAMTCKFCGAEIKENETVCSLCGTAVENTSAPVVEDAPAPVVEEVKPEPAAEAKSIVAAEEVKPEPAAEAESIVAAEEVKGETDAAPLWICTQCGKEFDSATKFCGECGGKVTEKNPVEEIAPVWICTKCGKEFDSATKFCGECGGKVAEKNDASAEEFDNNSAEAAKWYKKAEISKTVKEIEPENCCDGENEADFVEKCKQMLAELHDGNQYYVTSFDKNKLASAMESYGNGLVKNEKDIIIHHDSTAWGGAKEGFILTEYGIAYKDLFCEPAIVFFCETTDLGIHEKDNQYSDAWNI